MLRTVLAPNASPLTLGGTQTYVIGIDRVVVIDPGSSHAAHMAAVADVVGAAVVTAIAVTHAHPDHVGGADELADRFGCAVRMARRKTLNDGARLETDAGELTALATPGHTPDHMSLHWPAESAIFCGDLMMGGHDTALIAPPEGRLGPYLASLERLRSLDPAVLYPAHGPPFHSPGQAIDRYVRHRRLRLGQVRDAIAAGATGYDELVRAVYGTELEPGLADAAAAALKAYLQHLQGLGQIRRRGRVWEVVDP